MSWQATVLTIFPEMLPGPLAHSLAGKALAAGLWRLETVDIRDFTRDKHRSVDDAPFGGGPGMVMRPDVLDAAIEGGGGAGPLIHLSPRGQREKVGARTMYLLQQLEAEQVEKLAGEGPGPPFQPGETVRVSVRVVEGERERVQAFEGVCIARKNAGINSNFTLRKISYGEGVERVFPLYSPRISAIEVVRRGAVRRAKLYYLRARRGKAARIAERGREDNRRERVPVTGSASPETEA